MSKTGTDHWVGIPGLRTKDFCLSEDEDGNPQGTNIYVWTNRRDLDIYMAGPIWKLMYTLPHISNLEFKVVEVLQGSEYTAELGQWPKQNWIV